MAFHSLKNQTFRGSKTERSSQRERRGTVIKRTKKMHNGSRRHQDIGEVQIKNEERKTERVSEIGEGVRKE